MLRIKNFLLSCKELNLLVISFSIFIFNVPQSLPFSNGNIAVLNKQKNASNHSGFVPGVIIVKLKNLPALAKIGSPAGLPSLAKKIDRYHIRQIEHLATSVKSKNRHLLNNIYYFKFPDSENPQKIAALFARDRHVEYAEPKRIHRITTTPNDAEYTRQTYISKIGVEPAWDITKGEQGNVVIAIIDGGTDWDHVDLIDNIWTNPGEIAGNGIDDDQNGYVDDVHGWNFYNNSNDPTGPASQPTNQNHGTHTAGIAAARTNNNIGIAGMSWNCKLMPVCTAAFGEDGNIGFGFEGIIYAVENGADIVNCSWGSAGSPSQFEQDIINFATMNGTLIVAAAGNENSNNDLLPFYPAQYNSVLSVGGTSNKDDKVTSSNYGYSVDVFAPGQAIYSTLQGNNYGSNTGTSMASPLVAGIAGLVKTKNPQLTPRQLKERIRQSADWVEFTNLNAANSLSKGRINALRALTATDLQAIRLTDLTFLDSGGNGVINEGETIEMQLTFTSILGSANNISIILQSNSPEVQMRQTQKSIAALNPGETANLKFSFQVAPNTPDNTTLRFIVQTTSTNYVDYETIHFIVKPPVFQTHDNGILQTSITSCGNIGFTGYADENAINGYTFLDNGDGFVFKGRNTLYEGGLLIGASAAQISHSVRPITQSRYYEFTTANDSSLSIESATGYSTEHGSVTLFDSLANNPIGLKVEQDSYIYYDEPYTDFLILKYTLTNQNSTALQGIFAGIFVDWDINANAVDFARFSAEENLGWVQNRLDAPSVLSGTMLLNPEVGTGFQAINNALINDGFSDAEKWSMLSNGIQTQALNQMDVSTLVSAGPLDFQAGESKVVAFALVAGESRIGLLQNANAAKSLWQNNLIPASDNRAPKTTTSIFLNPVNSKHAKFTVISDKSLADPPVVKLIQSADTTHVAMTAIAAANTNFSGSYTFTAPGDYLLETSVHPRFGIDTTTTREFTLTNFSPETGTSITSTGADELFLPPAGLTQESFILTEVLTTDGATILSFKPELALVDSARLTMPLNRAIYPKPENVVIQQEINGIWQNLPTATNASGRSVSASIAKLGRFRLAFDPSAGVSEVLPASIVLQQNYPNPFNPRTTIEYTIEHTMHVSLEIYNAIGQKIATLWNGIQIAGTHRAQWNGKNDRNQQVPSGLYFYQMRTVEKTAVRKMLLLR